MWKAFVRSVLVWLGLWGGLGTASLAHASFFDSTPGKLARGHADIDGPTNCTKCHPANKREIDEKKCLDCHKPVADRMAQKSGLHGSQKALGRPCVLCHKEHRGLDADLFGWAALGGQQKFAHDTLSRFPLKGRHAVVECKDCHKQKTQTGRPSFLLAPTDCAPCHTKHPHGDMHGQVAACERCHDEKNWRRVEPLKFDHATDTRFPLEGKHVGTPCNSCHPRTLFRLTNWAADCTPCHKNVHGGSLFGQKKCALCHSAKVEWKTVDFDHANKTRFPLEGPHRKPCASCHTQTATRSPTKNCDSCHKDLHEGRFQKIGECSVCHLSSTWGPEIRFDHGRTRMALLGRHAAVSCRACHRGKTPAEYENFDSLVKLVAAPAKGKKGQQVSIDCLGCHQHQNVHKKQFKSEQCLQCHLKPGEVKQSLDPKNVQERVKIGHGPGTPFPLVDGHAIDGVRIKDCRACHKNDQFRNTPSQCAACHEDRLHKGSLGKDNCQKCHEGARWAATRFDHDKSNYPLVGKHKDARCESCHPNRRYKPTSQNCADAGCHLKDDAHGRSLGLRCEQCHSPTGQVTFDHNDPKAKDRYRLEGKHNAVRCQGCHPSLKYKPTPTVCQDCHADPEAHKNELGLRCQGCHKPTGWKLIHTGHDLFPNRFGGAHDRLVCKECHPKGRVLQGLAQLCIGCHQRDDVHHNSLGPRCGDCHTQQTFAGARFYHDRVGCTLTGVHRVLPCADCHKGGNYVGLSGACVSCHRDDAVRAAALRVTTDGMPPGAANRHDAQISCGSCHNTASFRSSRAGGTESVCR